MDSSSIFKLYVHESGADQTIGAFALASRVVTSIVSYAEVRAALARARRDRRIRSNHNLEVHRARFDGDWSSFRRVTPTEALSQRAGDLSQQHALSGFDAIHLSGALTNAPLLAAAFQFSHLHCAEPQTAIADAL